MYSGITKTADLKKQHKIDYQRFSRRRHSLFKKAFEMNKIWEDTTTYILVKKGHQFYVYNSCDGEDGVAWPPSPELLSKVWPQPKEYLPENFTTRGAASASEHESILSDTERDCGLITPRDSQSPEPTNNDWFVCFWRDMLEVPCPPNYPVF